jgi:hypothetical protein
LSVAQIAIGNGFFIYNYILFINLKICFMAVKFNVSAKGNPLKPEEYSALVLALPAIGIIPLIV